MSRGASRTAATSKMERFVIIVNGFLDVAAALNQPLMRAHPGNCHLLLSSQSTQVVYISMEL